MSPVVRVCCCQGLNIWDMLQGRDIPEGGANLVDTQRELTNAQQDVRGYRASLRTMRFGSTAKVLAECKLKYYRISECLRVAQAEVSYSCRQISTWCQTQQRNALDPKVKNQKNHSVADSLVGRSAAVYCLSKWHQHMQGPSVLL